MPYIIIEYPSDKLSPAQTTELVNAAHHAAAQSGLFDTTHIRTRAIPLVHYRLGDTANAFIHVQLRIHPGRDQTQKSQLSHAVLENIKALALSEIAVTTVEIVEMDKGSYAKYAG